MHRSLIVVIGFIMAVVPAMADKVLIDGVNDLYGGLDTQWSVDPQHAAPPVDIGTGNATLFTRTAGAGNDWSNTANNEGDLVFDDVSGTAYFSYYLYVQSIDTSAGNPFISWVFFRDPFDGANYAMHVEFLHDETVGQWRVVNIPLGEVPQAGTMDWANTGFFQIQANGSPGSYALWIDQMGFYSNPLPDPPPVAADVVLIDGVNDLYGGLDTQWTVDPQHAAPPVNINTGNATLFTRTAGAGNDWSNVADSSGDLVFEDVSGLGYFSYYLYVQSIDTSAGNPFISWVFFRDPFDGANYAMHVEYLHDETVGQWRVINIPLASVPVAGTMDWANTGFFQIQANGSPGSYAIWVDQMGFYKNPLPDPPTPPTADIILIDGVNDLYGGLDTLWEVDPQHAAPPVNINTGNATLFTRTAGAGNDWSNVANSSGDLVFEDVSGKGYFSYYLYVQSIDTSAGNPFISWVFFKDPYDGVNYAMHVEYLHDETVGQWRVVNIPLASVPPAGVMDWANTGFFQIQANGSPGSYALWIDSMGFYEDPLPDPPTPPSGDVVLIDGVNDIYGGLDTLWEVDPQHALPPVNIGTGTATLFTRTQGAGNDWANVANNEGNLVFKDVSGLGYFSYYLYVQSIDTSAGNPFISWVFFKDPYGSGSDFAMHVEMLHDETVGQWRVVNIPLASVPTAGMMDWAHTGFFQIQANGSPGSYALWIDSMGFYEDPLPDPVVVPVDDVVMIDGVNDIYGGLDTVWETDPAHGTPDQPARPDSGDATLFTHTSVNVVDWSNVGFGAGQPYIDDKNDPNFNALVFHDVSGLTYFSYYLRVNSINTSGGDPYISWAFFADPFDGINWAMHVEYLHDEPVGQWVVKNIPIVDIPMNGLVNWAKAGYFQIQCYGSPFPWEIWIDQMGFYKDPLPEPGTTRIQEWTLY